MLKDGVKLMSEQKRKTSMGDVTSRKWKLEKERTEKTKWKQSSKNEL